MLTAHFGEIQIAIPRPYTGVGELPHGCGAAAERGVSTVPAAQWQQTQAANWHHLQ